jgi:hypothetical protein
MPQGPHRVKQAAQLTPQNRAFFTQLTVIPLSKMFNNFIVFKDRYTRK